VSRHFQKLLAVGDVDGAVDPLEALLGELPELEADAIALVGNLAGRASAPEIYRTIFKALGDADCPAFWVPGPNDAPIRHYLRESYNIEIVHPQLHGVHGTVALGPDHVLFAGMGGEILDDPEAVRDEEDALRYPGWEVEYRLKVLREFDEHRRMLLFSTHPAHKRLDSSGSTVLEELIKTYVPPVAVVAGDRPGEELIGTTLVICPGRLDRGEYAVIDLHGPSARLGALAGAGGAKAGA
jgi:Icc-related predicted phosphoesterase